MPDESIDFGSGLDAGDSLFDSEPGEGPDPDSALLSELGAKPVEIPAESSAKTLDVRVKEELGAVALRLDAQRKASAARISLAMDVQYCLTLVFVSQDQRKEFSLKSGLGTESTRYVDGRIVARKLGVDLTPESYQPIKSKKKR